MPINRRQALKLTMAGIVASALPDYLISGQKSMPNIKAIAFDGFPIFDPRPIFALGNELLPTKGRAVTKLWFNKIFAYTWLRTVGGHYQTFDVIIKDALEFSVKSLNVNLSVHNKKLLLNSWLNLKVWPDVIPALKQFKSLNIRLGFLSNFTEDMLKRNARHAGIEKAFELYLSTDRVQTYKPGPKAYQMGVDEFGLPKENITFAAFAGWDATGASWFGYPTVWVNRLGFSGEELGGRNIIMGRELSTLVNFVSSTG